MRPTGLRDDAARNLRTVQLEILRLLPDVLARSPGVRFGQLVANLAVIAEGPWDTTLWDLGDEALLAALRQLNDDLAARAA